MKIFRGDRTIDGIVVTVDGEPLDPRFDVHTYSINGFEWTYEGDESRQLALAMILEQLGDVERAKVLTEPFMVAVVANMDNTWEMTSDEIEAAIVALEAS